VLTARFAAQLLSGAPATSPVGVVRRLLAVQAQDPRGARLAIRVRSAGLTAADVDNALTADRSLLITWLNRGTLHLVCSEDYWWLHALTAPRMAATSARRLAQEGVLPSAADTAVAVIAAAVTADGPLTRAQLRERLASAGVRTEGQALVHLLLLASQRAGLVRGPMIGSEHAFVLARDWIERPPAPVDRDAALAELGRRYLAGHGPATDRDLAKWSGLPLRDARRGLAAIVTELSDRDDGGLPPPRLLGAFDPLLLGWASREPVVGAHQGIVTTNGVFRPFALVSGVAAATWTLSGGTITLKPLVPIAPADESALLADAADVRRFLAGPDGSIPAQQ